MRWTLVTAAILMASPLAAQEDVLPGHIRVLAPAANGPLPVVIWASGCSGFFHPRAPWHFVERAQKILKEGYAVAFVDYLSTEHLSSACQGEMSLDQIGTVLIEAASALESVPDLDTGRLVYLGGSLGGGGVLAALSHPAFGDHEPMGVIALYPSCVGLGTWDVETPVRLYFAAEDQITPPDGCAEVLNGSSESIQHTYADAHHGFDMRGLPTELATGQAAIAYHHAAAEDVWDRIAEVLRALR